MPAEMETRDDPGTDQRQMPSPPPPVSQLPTSRPFVDLLNSIKMLISDVWNPNLTAKQRSEQAALLINAGLALLENLAPDFEDKERLLEWIDTQRELLGNLPPPRLQLESAVSQGIRVLKIKTTDPTMNVDSPSEAFGLSAFRELREQAHGQYLHSLLPLVTAVSTELTIRGLLPMNLEDEDGDVGSEIDIGDEH